MNPAFEIGRQTANTMSRAFTQREDANAIESILSEAMQSGDPQVIQNSIGKILSQVSPERQGTAIQYLQNTFQNLQAKQEKERSRAAAQKEGINPDLSPELQKIKYKSQLNQNVFENIRGGKLPGQQSSVPQGTPSTPMQQPASQGQELAKSLFQNQQSPTGQPQQQPQQQVQPQKQGIAALSEDDLIALTSIPEYRDAAKAELQRKQEEKKLIEEQRKQDRKEALEFHKESSSYYERILDEGEKAQRQIESLSDIEGDIKAGKVKPTSLANVFKGFGAIGDKISEALLTGEEAKIGGILPYLLEGWKAVFGVRLSDADLRVLQDKLPSIGKSPEANLAVIKIMQKYGKQTQLRSKIARDIEKNNGGLRPPGFRNMVEEAFQQSVQMVPIIRPKKNPNDPDVIINIPLFELPAAIQSGGRMAG